jgi:transposase
MAARFVTIDHDTPLLRPPDLRDWVPENHLVHFVMDSVGLLNLGSAQTNNWGTGSAQYPPSMMLGLLIYCYCSGTFSSRKIEGLTYDSVPVRYLCADTHPDHDSICKFRRENKELIESAFHQFLECAAHAKILKVGDITVSVDGTKTRFTGHGTPCSPRTELAAARQTSPAPSPFCELLCSPSSTPQASPASLSPQNTSLTPRRPPLTQYPINDLHL